MRTRERVAELFDFVKRTYFPRWDKAGRWKVEFADSDLRRGSTGYCDSKARCIYLSDDVCRFTDDDYVVAFLIHEICHDVAAAHHIKSWVVRMEAAAKLAERRGEYGIAHAVRNESFSYGDFQVYREVTGLTDSPMS